MVDAKSRKAAPTNPRAFDSNGVGCSISNQPALPYALYPESLLRMPCTIIVHELNLMSNHSTEKFLFVWSVDSEYV